MPLVSCKIHFELSWTKNSVMSNVSDANNLKRFPIDSFFQGVNRLFVLAFDNTNNASKVEKIAKENIL